MLKNIESMVSLIKLILAMIKNLHNKKFEPEDQQGL